jgi:membrane-associated phospholipid phosphatase
MAATEIIIGVCLLGVVLVWWRTRQWWYAVIPLLAITLQAIIFVSAAAVVGRPRPPVPKLDTSPPTASFPSGHEGASTALYLSFLLMATRIRNRTLRYAAMTPLRDRPPSWSGIRGSTAGMHHISDLLAGMLVGGTSAVLAWNYLRRSERTPA